ncbi:MAG: tetratricopeptide repeat protein [Lentisphaerae bacterium]|nr:tetratricopeptide repeat protein [Lentisphaerota bacterium]
MTKRVIGVGAALLAGLVALLPAGTAISGDAPPAPDPLELRAEAARLAREGAYDAALHKLERAAAATPAPAPDITAEIIDVLARADRTREAIDLYEALPPAYEKPVALLLTIARCYRLEREFEKARNLYRFLAERDPDDRDAVRGLVLTLFDMGEQGEALALLDKVAGREAGGSGVADAPALPQPAGSPTAGELHQQAMDLARQEGYTMARELLEKALEQPDAGDAIRADYVVVLARCAAYARAAAVYDTLPVRYAELPAVARAAAGAFQRTGRFADAARLYALLLDADPGDAEAAVGRVSALIGLDDFETARTAVRDALLRHPNNVPLLFARARIEAERNAPDDALATYDRILSLDPGNGEARALSAPLLVRAAAQAAPARAVSLYRKAFERMDRVPPALRAEYVLALARALRYAQAIEAYERLPPEQADRPELAAAAALCYRQEQQPERAASLYRRALQARPDDTAAARGLVRLLIERGREAEALDAARAALDANPDDPELLFARAELESRLERPAAAVATYSRLLRIEPENDEARRLKAEQLALMARDAPPDAAVELLAEAARLSPGDPALRAAYIIALVQADRQAEALVEFATYPDAESAPPGLDLAVAHCYYDAEQYGAADTFYARVLEAEPANRDAALGRIRTAARLGDNDTARTLIDAALADRPYDIDVLFEKARLHETAQQYAAALETYDRILALNPDNPKAVQAQQAVFERVASAEAETEPPPAAEDAAALAAAEAEAALPAAPEAAVDPDRPAEWPEDAAPAAEPPPAGAPGAPAAAMRAEAEAEADLAATEAEAAPPAGPEPVLEAEPAAAELEPPLRPETAADVAPAAEPATTAEPPLRAVRFGLEPLYGTAPGDRDAALDAFAGRAAALNVNAVFLEALGDPDATGSPRAAWFPNRVLPLRADLLNAAVAVLRAQGFAVYLSMPVIGIALPDRTLQERLLVRRDTGGARPRPSRSLRHRLSPFSEEAQDLVMQLYGDLADAVSVVDGLVFGEDAFLTDFEDFHPDAVSQCTEALGLDVLRPLQLSAADRAAWTKLKTLQLNALTRSLATTVRHRHPDARFGRRLFAPALHYPPSEAWLAQTYASALDLYDCVVVAAEPELEDVARVSVWLRRLVRLSAEYPDGIGKTLFSVSAYDGIRQRPVGDRVVARRVDILLEAGARHVIVGPVDAAASDRLERTRTVLAAGLTASSK